MLYMSRIEESRRKEREERAMAQSKSLSEWMDKAAQAHDDAMRADKSDQSHECEECGITDN